MSLRKQRGGFQKHWTIDELRDGFNKFYLEHKKYPTSEDVDNFPYLPSARSIQRSHGGLVAVRKELGLSSNNEHDFTKGEYSSKRARLINKRGHKYETIVYEFLKNKFSIQFVHREFFLTDDSRSRIDFYIYHKEGVFAVDVFYPKNRRNLINCLNSKMRTYSIESMHNVPVIFLQMNNEISSEILKEIVKNKKNRLKNNQYLMNIQDLKEYCEYKKVLKVV